MDERARDVFRSNGKARFFGASRLWSRVMLNEMVRNYGTLGKGLSARDNIVIKGMKALHLLAATAWAGGALSMQALSFLRLSSADPEFAAQVAVCLHFVDTWVVMPGLAGCLLTGLFYSSCTAIGFFKFAWIGYKWLISLCAGFWGTMFWGPWGDDLIARLRWAWTGHCVSCAPAFCRKACGRARCNWPSFFPCA